MHSCDALTIVTDVVPPQQLEVLVAEPGCETEQHVGTSSYRRQVRRRLLVSNAVRSSFAVSPSPAYRFIGKVAPLVLAHW